MIRNFEAVKAQLSELAGFINLFKSEAVQLKITELVLGTPPQLEGEDEAGAATPSQRNSLRRRRAAQPQTRQHKQPKARRAATGTGAAATLAQLTGTTFFDKDSTINDIIEHCKNKLARGFKANEFSGKLGRMVRMGQLTREKNAEGQYEYKKR